MSESEAPAVEPARERNPLREFRESSTYAALHREVARRPWLWPYGGLIALIGLVMWPAWFSSGRLIIGGDMLFNYYPWFELWRDELSAGRFPFWNPYTFSGMPGFATPHSGYAYPLNWLATPLPPILAANWLIGFHVVLGGLSAAWCAGRLGASKDGQFLSGAAFALGSVMVSRLNAGHLQHLEAIAWLPLATGLAIDANKPLRPVLLAIVVAMIALTGQLEVLIFAGWWVPLWAFCSALGGPRKAVATRTLKAVAALASGAGLAAFFLLPFLALNEISNRSEVTDEFRLIASLPIWHLLEVLNPGVFGTGSGYWAGEQYEWIERLFYIGPVTLFVALLARGKFAYICFGVTALAICLAFGKFVFWYDITAHLPVYSEFRVPSKHLELAALGLCLGAGLGLDRLNTRAGVVAVALAALLFGAGMAATLWLPSFINLLGGLDGVRRPAPIDLGEATASAVTPMVISALSLAVVALLSRLPRTWFRRGVLAVAVLELVLVLGAHRFDESDPNFFVRQAEIFGGRDRAAMLDTGALEANYGPVTGVKQPAGYNAIFSGEYQHLLVGVRNAGVIVVIPKGYDRLAYLLGYPAIIQQNPPSVTVYEPPPPQAWVARCSWPGGAEQARAADFPLFLCVTRPDATTREQPVDRGSAEVLKESPGHLRVRAEGPGYLTTVQPWYPGWTARIDGKKADVEVLDGALVGTLLPAGTHTVEFDYLPARFKEGLLVTGLTILLLGGIALWERRNAQRAR